jgi:hypothetical protein
MCPAQVLADPTSFDVAVTTYEMVTSAHFGAALSHTITWRLLVLDEGHKIKNEETRVANAMRHVACGCTPARSCSIRSQQARQSCTATLSLD